LLIAARHARIMLMMRTFSVYIVASPSRVIYVGVTNDLERRIAEHREKASAGFTARYNLTRLVYFEQYDRATEAIANENDARAVGVPVRAGNRESLHVVPGSFDSGRNGLRSG
jgi:putative endonuclease